MLSTFKWGLNVCILAKQGGWRLEKWGSCTLTYLEGDPDFWRSKISPMGRNDPGGHFSLRIWLIQNWKQMVQWHSARWHESNGAKITSNGLRMEKLWPSEVQDKQLKSQSQNIEVLTWQYGLYEWWCGPVRLMMWTCTTDDVDQWEAAMWQFPTSQVWQKFMEEARRGSTPQPPFY
jgi:hypothetical protein